MIEPPSTRRAAWILLRLRGRRLVNRMGAIFLGRKSRQGKRGATAGKAHRGWLLSTIFGLLLFFSYLNLGYQALRNLDDALGKAPATESSPPSFDLPGPLAPADIRLPSAPGRVVSAGFLKGAFVVMTLLFLAVLFTSMANREISRPEWDLEWLVTLPVPLSSLLKMRVLERALLNLLGLFAIPTFASVLAWYCGYGLWSVLLGALVSLCMLGLIAVIQTVTEGALRLAFSPGRIRNFQAAFYITGLILLYLAISVGVGAGRERDYFLYDLARGCPGWISWLPTGLAVEALAGSSATRSATALVLLALEALLVAGPGLRYLQWRLRSGVVSGGMQESVRRGEMARPRERVEGAPKPRRLFTPLQSKEVLLLGRDRNFLVQSLLLPVVIGGLQIAINPGLLRGAMSEPQHLGAFAFGITAYVLMFSAFQVLNSEGHSLWLLFTLPHRLERIVTEKALLWGGLALIYPCVIFGLAIGFSGNVSLETVGVFTLVLLGVPVYALIAACLGVIGSNPLDQDVQRRVRPRQAYLYMILASLYAYTIYASTHWQRFSLLTLTALLAFALWQKARDQLPYLLDPVSLPPPRASLADGLIAGQIFFVLQALLALALRGSELSAGLVTLVAFTVGGGLTYGIMRVYYWKRRVLGVPGLLKGAPAGRALAVGALFGGLAAAGGLLYLVLVHQTGLLPTRGFETVDVERETLLWLFLLAVVLAPVFEEFIFRGLIFGGLRRSFGLVASVLGSAAVFAVVHPPFSVAPVFLLGVCSALAYEKTRGLLAPILTHAVYNAVLLSARFAGV